MEDNRLDATVTVTILDVLGVDLCARAILDCVPVRDLVRSERVCRRWQAVVLGYMRCCHRLDDVYYASLNLVYKTTNLKRDIYHAHRSLLEVCKSLAKFGYPQEELSDKRFENIVSKYSECPYLRYLQGLNRTCFEQNCRELKMTDILKDIRQIKLERVRNFRDRGINVIIGNPTNILSAIFNLRNVTTLELDDQDMTNLDYAHLLLNEMPQLENLSLCNYTWKLCNAPCMVTNEQLIESITGLANLKRLIMRNNEIVNDVLLHALARRSRKLNYLDVSYDRADGGKKILYSPRAIIVLCRRLPTATTTLCLGYVQNFTSRGLKSWLQTMPVVQELQTLGYVVLTPQWLAEACRASRAQRHPLELKVEGSGCSSPGRSSQIDESHTDVKIVLGTDVHTEEKYGCETRFLVEPLKTL